jgi:YVTN family beta-propeller protein
VGLAIVATACGGKDRSGQHTDSVVQADADSAAAPAALPSAPLAYVTNEESQDLTVINTTNDSVVATIPVGTRPRGVKVSPDGRRVYVALSGSPKCPPSMPDEECAKLKSDKSKDGIAAVDPARRRVERIFPGGSDPETFDLSKDGTRLYVSNEDAGTATIVDAGTGQIVKTVPVGKEPEGVRVHPDGKTVWITGETDHDITIISADSGRRLGHIVVDKRPRGIAFTPDGLKAYVTCEVGGTVQAIDVRSRKIAATIKLPGEAKPMGVVAHPDGKRVFVSTGRGGQVVTIDVASNRVVDSVTVGKRPWGIALTEDGSKLYSANGPSNDVSVVATDRLRVLKTVPAGKTPWGVAIGARR